MFLNVPSLLQNISSQIAKRYLPHMVFVKGRLFTVPYFSVGFSRLVCFDRTPALLAHNGERNLGRVSKLLRGAGVGRGREKYLSRSSSPTQRTITRAPLGSSGTLPRLRSPLQTKMAGVRSKLTSLENPTGK